LLRIILVIVVGHHLSHLGWESLKLCPKEKQNLFFCDAPLRIGRLVSDVPGWFSGAIWLDI
jgi:hypothetical protein